MTRTPKRSKKTHSLNFKASDEELRLIKIIREQSGISFSKMVRDTIQFQASICVPPALMQPIKEAQEKEDN